MCGPKAIKPGGQCKLMLKILCKLNSYLAFGGDDMACTHILKTSIARSTKIKLSDCMYLKDTRFFFFLRCHAAPYNKIPFTNTQP